MDILNVPINTTEWTEIILGQGVICREFKFETRSGAGFKVKGVKTDTDYFTIRRGGTLRINDFKPVFGTVLFCAQAVSKEDTIEGISAENLY